MLRWAITLVGALFALPVYAGPWVRQDDAFYSRLAISPGTIEGLNAYRLDSYSEYGLSSRWTATFKYEELKFDGFSEFDSNGWRVTARRGFSLGKGIVASVEAGLLQGAAIGGAAGCEALGLESRAGLGQSATIGRKQKTDIYWFVEVAARVHEDDCVRRRLDFGYGQNVFGNMWAISQVWLDSGTTNASSQKYQFEYLWKTSRADVSLGTITEFGGAFEETAFFIALAREF